MATIKQVVGQSSFDLTLQVYGTQDKLIQFCVDNNISNLNEITPQIDYEYDQTQVQYQNASKATYATDVAFYNRIFSDEFSMEFA